MPKCCKQVLIGLGAATVVYHGVKLLCYAGKKVHRCVASKNKQRAVLITGACGELGHSLVQAIKEKYHDQIAVITLDLSPLPTEMKPYVTKHFIGSVTDKSVFDDIHKSFICLRIYHLASLLSTSGENNPILAADVNMNGFLRVVEFALKQKEVYGKDDSTFVPRLIFTSSIAAFGVNTLEEKIKAGAVTEDQCAHPLTMYGLTKLQCEALGTYFEQNYHMLPNGPMVGQIDFRCLRYAGLISAFTVPNGGTSDYGPEMLHYAAQGKPYEAFVAPTTQMPFMTMDDAVTAIMMLSDADKTKLVHPVYNVAAWAPTAQEIADEVKKHFPAADISFTQKFNPRVNIVNSWPADMNCDAARADFGFVPKHNTMSVAFTDYLLPHVKARYGVKK